MLYCCQDRSSARSNGALAINTFEIQRVIAHRQQFWLQQLPDNSLSCKAYISSALAGITSWWTIAAFPSTASLSKNREEWLSTEPFFLSNSLFSRPLFLNLFVNPSQNPLWLLHFRPPCIAQVLTGSHSFLLHRINTNKYHVNSSTTRDILPTYPLRQVGPKWGGYNRWSRQCNNLGDNI